MANSNQSSCDPPPPHTQDRVESALAMFDKAVDVWYKFLGGAQQQQQLLNHSGGKNEGMMMIEGIQLTEAQVGEVSESLSG